jgi:Glycosyltransferase family 87
MTHLPRRDGPAWPRDLAGRARRFVAGQVERERVWFVGLAFLAINLALLGVSFATSDGGRTALSPVLGADHAALGGDYPAFYVAGTLLNRYPPQRLYDLDLQARLFHHVMYNISVQRTLYYAHPPFFAWLLRPLACMPYGWSYLVFLTISLALYVAGFALAWRSAGSIPRGEWPLALLLALSFQPFVMECWRGGQLSAFGFFWVAVALRCWATGRPGWAGVALGFCLYKPTLLVLVLPMLVVGRQARALVGFAACGLVLAGVSWLGVGREGCLDYLKVLTLYSRASVDGGGFYPIDKFFDLSSFLTMAGLRPGGVGVALAALFVVPVLAALALGWWGFAHQDGPARARLFTATLTLSLVVNLHVAAYDTILVVPGVLLAASVLFEPSGGRAPGLTPAYQTLLVLVYVVPWFSQHVARATGFQPFTLVLAALGCFELAQCLRLAPEFRFLSARRGCGAARAQLADET